MLTELIMASAAMTLKLTGVTGESTATGHIGEIDLVSWGWGLQGATHSLHDGSPGGASSFSDLTITKLADRSTPVLLHLCDAHRVVSDATLTVEKASGNEPLQYITIDMSDVRIIDVHLTSEGTEVHEQVRLSCQTMTINYTPQASTGAAGTAPISFTADHSNKQG
jgi:type VI secretion system secreted protein Hcp